MVALAAAKFFLMMDLKNLGRAVQQVAEEKGIDPAKVVDAIESSIAAAYKKEYEKRGEIVKARLNLKTGELKFWQIKTVVDTTTVEMRKDDAATEESTPVQTEMNDDDKLPRYNPDRHIFIEEARAIKKDIQLGEEMEFLLEPHEDFGRIAAQTAKQVVLQRLREAERESVLAEFQHREGEVVSGVVQRMERGNVYIDLGRAVGVLYYNESIPGEHYRVGERLRFLILAVQDDAKMPGIVLSRAHPKFISKLFTIEVPEIADGSVEIKGVAREPGSRTKIAVASSVSGIDPVGACVGQRGTRVIALSNELGQEKLDIIEWVDDQAQFIANSLSPAKATGVELLQHHEAHIFVPDAQLSLAIGKGGQNVRLAAKLTGWNIDVRSETRPDETQTPAITDVAAVPLVGEDADEDRTSVE